MQKPIIVKNSSIKQTFSHLYNEFYDDRRIKQVKWISVMIISLLTNLITTEKRNFTVFDAENILSKVAQRLKTLTIWIPTTLITSDKKFCIL